MENDRKARVILDSYCTQVVTNSRDKVTNKKKRIKPFYQCNSVSLSSVVRN